MIASWLAWVGLLGGAAMGLLGWWWGRYMIKGSRGLDERYLLAWQQARAKGWLCSLFAIFALFVALFLGLPLSAPVVLSILLMIHMLSWALFGVYYIIRS
ncbi:hypothetical protein ACFQ88_15225 [Paenibacillus sp. NPDC056579]|uniref:hypothetical protein n=1 Tax=unclassified Paenibacillus TaxID=185978 RepID=UPI001EF88F08|nr:hypothetical protein [Paenibacillus sp. H1-7]ULL17766.1 hypothetical protein DVH26_26900 [Paenibacillus sp. H1-7]